MSTIVFCISKWIGVLYALTMVGRGAAVITLVKYMIDNLGIEYMFAVIYKFKLKPSQEELYQHHWHKIANFFIKNRGAIGSCLHKGDNGVWVAYSRWPDKATRDASWPGEGVLNNELPDEISHSIKIMQAIKKENSKDMENDYEELCLDVVNDLLFVSS